MLRKAAFPVLIRTAPGIRTRWIRITQLAKENDLRLSEKVESAVSLICEHDSVMCSRVRRLRWLVVANLPEPGGEYWSELNVCALDADYVQKAPVPRIALVIVHEATHARVAKLAPQMDAKRAECICMRAELAFAKKLPGADEHAQRIKKSFTKEWWHERHDGEADFRLRELGFPEWLVRFRSCFWR
jgi:hypothetical protein